MTDWESEARFFPAALLLGVTGAIGTMLTLSLAAFESPLWPLSAILAALLVIDAALLDATRPWSIGLARRIAPACSVVWLASMVVLDSASDAGITAWCLAMVALSFAVAVQLAEPDAPASAPTADGAIGWIEEMGEER